MSSATFSNSIYYLLVNVVYNFHCIKSILFKICLNALPNIIPFGWNSIFYESDNDGMLFCFTLWTRMKYNLNSLAPFSMSHQNVEKKGVKFRYNALAFENRIKKSKCYHVAQCLLPSSFFWMKMGKMG